MSSRVVLATLVVGGLIGVGSQAIWPTLYPDDSLGRVIWYLVGYIVACGGSELIFGTADKS